MVNRRLDDLDTVVKCDALDDLRQLVFAFQPPPGFRGGHDELEHHQPGGGLRERPLGPHGPMAHGGEDALDRVR